MDFKVGQTFVDTYPPEAAEWCNGNRAYIIEVEKDGEHRQFQIVAYHELSLEKLKEEKKSLIDAETSAAILAGFDYAVDGVNYYHFSYALDDQQNFADTVNVCLMKQSGMPGLPDSVTWNAYTPDGELARLTFDAPGFLALYAGGAMKHKNETMQRGGERKAVVEAATTPEEVEAA